MSWNPFSAPQARTPEETDTPDEPEVSSTPSTLAERRATAREDRAVTRRTASTSTSVSAPTTTSSGHLRLPTPADRIRSISRSRSPSPSPSSTSTSGHFELPPPAAMEPDAIQRLCAEAVEYALRKDREERDRTTQLATQAAVAAALANQTSQVRALRKPDLPALDKKHIQRWLSRVEAAYTRNEVTTAKDKFAFIESKFTVDADAKINQFLEKPNQTTDDWEAFKRYLVEIHGLSKRDRVKLLLQGVSRDGRRPNQYAAAINELLGPVTLDDILKEIFLKDIPAEVRQHANKAYKNKSFLETAEHLEDYFDQKGKVLESNSSSGINSVASGYHQQQQQQPRQPSAMKQNSSRANSPSFNHTSTNNFTAPFSEDEEQTDVNAVRFQRQQQSSGARSQSRGRPQYRNDSQQRSSSRFNNNSRGRFANSSSNSNNNGRNENRYPTNSSSNSNGSNSSGKGKLCSFHVSYGDKARSCKEHCLLWSQHLAKGQASQ